MNSIKLSDHFTYGRLLRFVWPSIVMMVFLSVYSVVDGLFVSNFVGKEALAAVNLAYPLIMLLASFGMMVGTGGSALIAKVYGEGDADRSRALFTLLAVFAVVGSVVLMIVGLFFLDPVLRLMKAEGPLFTLAYEYGFILLLSLPFFVVANAFQTFFIAAERPKIGLVVMVLSGVSNMVLDALFIAVFGWGVIGAAIATALAQVVGSVFALAFFFVNKTSWLRFARPVWDLRGIGQSCLNGCSELLTNAAASVVSMLYNYQLMVYVGADGVAAYSVIMYVAFIFAAIFVGFTFGTEPIVSFHFGAQNKDELKNLFRKGIAVAIGGGVIMVACAELFAPVLASWFVGYDRELYDMTVYAFRIYALSYLICGVPIFASGWFTALNNGPVSAAISAIRTLICETAAVMLLPLVLGVTGIWAAILVAETLALIVAVIFFAAFRKRYGYV